MKVTTIDGGFRGLANATAKAAASAGSVSLTQVEALERFNARIAAYESARIRFQAARAAGKLSASDVQSLAATFSTLDDEIERHRVMISSATDASAVQSAYLAAEDTLQRVSAAERRAALTLSSVEGVRGWQVALACAGGIAVVALILYWPRKR